MFLIYALLCNLVSVNMDLDSLVWSLNIMESDSGSAYKSRFLYQLHCSPVPHSDRLISPHPSVSQGEKDRPHGERVHCPFLLIRHSFTVS